jgi:uncharacterized protein
MKLLCDQMLMRLGRWLRAAGYDTAIVEKSCSDNEIWDWAVAEGRLLLTRDRHFLERDPAGKIVIWFKSNLLQDCVRELNQKLALNWLQKPFSRCLICNCELVEPDAAALQLVPEAIRAEEHDFWFCERCQKAYWDGSHTQRMLRQLQVWHALPLI